MRFLMCRLATNNNHIGVLVTMIDDMIFIDLVVFFQLAGAMIFGFGMLFVGLHDISGPTTVGEVMALPWWGFIGEFLVDDPVVADASRSTYIKIFVYLAAVVNNVILVNLLIAQFSETYTKVKEQEKVSYAFQRYCSIYEVLYVMPALPPPLSLPISIYLLGSMILFGSRSSLNEQSMRKGSSIKLAGGEADLVRRFLETKAETKAAAVEHKVDAIKHGLDAVETRLLRQDEQFIQFDLLLHKKLDHLASREGGPSAQAAPAPPARAKYAATVDPGGRIEASLGKLVERMEGSLAALAERMASVEQKVKQHLEMPEVTAVQIQRRPAGK